MSTTIRALAMRASAVVTAVVLTTSAAAAASTTLEELTAELQQAWQGEVELVGELYAADGVHTATFYDRTNEYQGPSAVEPLAGLGWVDVIGPRVDLPADDREFRWADFASLGGGTACLWHAVDGRVTRQDCVLAKRSTDSRPAAAMDPESIPAAEALTERLMDSWGTTASVERLGEVYAPDAVHTARYLDETRRYEGPIEIREVAQLPVTFGQIGPIVAFQAPRDQLAWAQVNDVAGGSVCLFHAVDGLVTRHDCVLPVAAP